MVQQILHKRKTQGKKEVSLTGRASQSPLAPDRAPYLEIHQISVGHRAVHGVGSGLPGELNHQKEEEARGDAGEGAHAGVSQGVVCCRLLFLPPLWFPSTDLPSVFVSQLPCASSFYSPPALRERKRDRTLPILSLAAIKQLSEEQQKMPF